MLHGTHQARSSRKPDLPTVSQWCMATKCPRIDVSNHHVNKGVRTVMVCRDHLIVFPYHRSFHRARGSSRRDLLQAVLSQLHGLDSPMCYFGSMIVCFRSTNHALQWLVDRRYEDVEPCYGGCGLVRCSASAQKPHRGSTRHRAL